MDFPPGLLAPSAETKNPTMLPLSKMRPLGASCLHFMTFLSFRTREFGAAEQGEPGQEAEGLPVGLQFGTG